MLMRMIPGRAFGSNHPTTVYVAMRWNNPKADRKGMERMLKYVSGLLNIKNDDLLIYNLLPPAKGYGMRMRPEDFREAGRTIRRIVENQRGHRRLQRIIVGGKGGPMSVVALALKLLLPRIRIELRNHHRARKPHGGPFGRLFTLTIP